MADDESIHYKANVDVHYKINTILWASFFPGKKKGRKKNQTQARNLAGMPGRILKQK